MNRNLAIAFVLAAAAGTSFADDITVDTTPFASTATRAEVQAELDGFKQSGVNPWSNQYNPLAQFSSQRSRAAVTAEYATARDQVAAFTAKTAARPTWPPATVKPRLPPRSPASRAIRSNVPESLIPFLEGFVMKITILGSGNMAAAFVKQLSAAGHQVRVTGRNLAKVTELAGQYPGVERLEPRAAAQDADAVIVATPYEAAVDALRSLGDLNGKVVIDITNPLTPDYMGLTIGHDTSAAEQIAQAIPGAQVVKGFNTLFAQVLAAGADFGDSRKASVFLASRQRARQADSEGAGREHGVRDPGRRPPEERQVPRAARRSQHLLRLRRGHGDDGRPHLAAQGLIHQGDSNDTFSFTFFNACWPPAPAGGRWPCAFRSASSSRRTAPRNCSAGSAATASKAPASGWDPSAWRPAT